jgi:hypothetical protein
MRCLEVPFCGTSVAVRCEDLAELEGFTSIELSTRSLV